MISCLSPPITVVFLMGALWRRGTTQAAQVTLVLGFVLGVCTFCLDFFTSPQYLTVTQGIPFLMQAWWLICVSFALFVGTSLATPPPAEHQLRGLCVDMSSSRRQQALLRAAQGDDEDDAESTRGEGGCPQYMARSENLGLCFVAVSVFVVVLCRAASLSVSDDPNISVRPVPEEQPEVDRSTTSSPNEPASRLINYAGLVTSLVLLVYGLYVRRLAPSKPQGGADDAELIRAPRALEELRRHTDSEVAEAAEYAISMGVARRASLAVMLVMLSLYSFVL